MIFFWVNLCLFGTELESRSFLGTRKSVMLRDKTLTRYQYQHISFNVVLMQVAACSSNLISSVQNAKRHKFSSSKTISTKAAMIYATLKQGKNSH